MTRLECEQALTSDDVEARRFAVVKIGQSEDVGLGSLLLMALGDTDWRVRKEAVGVAALHAERLGILDGLIGAICQGENVGLRNAALNVLELLGPRAADVLLDALPRVDVSARRFVVEALACGGGPRVIDTLARAAGNEDANLAAAAIDVLANIGGVRAEEILRHHVTNVDPFLRMAALEGLNRLGVSLDWDELRPVLEDRLARRVAIPALGRTGRREAVAPLFQALGLRSTQYATSAACAIVDLSHRNPSLLSELQQQARELNDTVRSQLRVSALHGDQAVRQACTTILCWARDSEGLVAAVHLAWADALSLEATEALRSWGEPAVRPLLGLVSRRDGTPRGTALELACDLAAALETDRNQAALSADIRRLLLLHAQDREPAVATAAVRCLADWAEPEDTAMLIETAMSAQSEDLAHAAGHALSVLANRAPDAVADAVAGVALDGTGGGVLARVVAAVGGEGAFGRLQSALAAQAPATRCAAIDGLARIGGAAAADLISFSMADENLDVQMTAARALGRLRDPDGKAIGLDALLLALESESSAVQAAAARALGEIGDARAVEPLRQLASSPVAGVALAAVEALRDLQDDRLGELIDALLDHPDGEVVKQSLYAVHASDGGEARAKIAKTLNHASWDVRQQAAHLLGQYKDASTVSALQVRLAVEEDVLVRQAIEDALVALIGRRA